MEQFAEQTANLLAPRRAGAEGVGFEPTEPVARLNGFQDRRLRPLGHPSRDRRLRRRSYYVLRTTYHDNVLLR